MSEIKEVTRDTIIGDIREKVPGGNDVLTKVFGPGCFGCPNSKTKTIEFGCRMHGKDVDAIVSELNENIKNA